MPHYKLECQYCGKKWEDYHYSDHAAIENAKCPKCNDRNIKIGQKESGDIFGYNKK